MLTFANTSKGSLRTAQTTRIKEPDLCRGGVEMFFLMFLQKNDLNK